MANTLITSALSDFTAFGEQQQSLQARFLTLASAGVGVKKNDFSGHFYVTVALLDSSRSQIALMKRDAEVWEDTFELPGGHIKEFPDKDIRNNWTLGDIALHEASGHTCLDIKDLKLAIPTPVWLTEISSQRARGPEHPHYNFTFLATSCSDRIRPMNPRIALRWFTLEDAASNLPTNYSGLLSALTQAVYSCDRK